MSTTEDTRSLVVDYVEYQLSKKSLPWPGHAADDAAPPPSKVNQTMRVLGEEFEERYTQVSIDASCHQGSFRAGTHRNAVPVLFLITGTPFRSC